MLIQVQGCFTTALKDHTPNGTLATKRGTRLPFEGLHKNNAVLRRINMMNCEKVMKSDEMSGPKSHVAELKSSDVLGTTYVST